MYVSPVVRTISEDPDPDEEVRLVVRFDPETTDADVRGAVADAGGRVVDELQFGGVEAVVPQPAVEDLLDLPVDAVETAAVLGRGDAGEDL